MHNSETGIIPELGQYFPPGIFRFLFFFSLSSPTRSTSHKGKITEFRREKDISLCQVVPLFRREKEQMELTKSGGWKKKKKKEKKRNVIFGGPRKNNSTR